MTGEAVAHVAQGEYAERSMEVYRECCRTQSLHIFTPAISLIACSQGSSDLPSRARRSFGQDISHPLETRTQRDFAPLRRYRASEILLSRSDYLAASNILADAPEASIQW